jgi:hypothetical protein
VRGHRGHLARLVRLDAADRHQRVAALRQRLGNQVLQLAGLVAAEGEGAVAVLALGIQLHLAAQVRAQALQRLDRRRAEGEGMAGVALQVHGMSVLWKYMPGC